MRYGVLVSRRSTCTPSPIAIFRWALLVYKDALSRGAGGAWTASAGAVAYVVLGQGEEAHRVLKRASRQGHINLERGLEDEGFSPFW